jgi:hypothetical protein
MQLRKWFIPVLRKLVPSLGILCFLFPFVSVKSCNSEAVTNYYGFQLLLHDGGWVYAVSIGLSALFLASAFITRKRSCAFSGFFCCGALILSVLGFSIIVFYPDLQFLFHQVYPRTGLVLGGISWVTLYFLYWVLTVGLVRDIRTRNSSLSRVHSAWTVLLLVSAVIAVLIPYTSLMKEISASKLAVSSLVVLFFSTPFAVMLYFVREAIREGFMWGRVCAILFPVVLAAAAAACVFIFR